MPAATTTIKKIYSSKIKNRRAARIIAIQCLYSTMSDVSAADNIDEKLTEIISMYESEMSDSKLAKANLPLLINLTRFAVSNEDEIKNAIIPNLAVNWRFERLPKVVSCILRCAVAEMFYDKTLDIEIIINDYLEIAKLFNHEGEVGFINSVLDKISKAR